MDNQVPLPAPNSPMPQNFANGPAPNTPIASASPSGAGSATDPLAQASAAIEAAIAQTPHSPAERLDAITAIKSNYIKQQFGVDVNQ